MRSNNKISLVAATALLLLPTIVSAADAVSDDQGGHYNTVLISLVSLMVVLLFVIGMLANTLRQLTFVIRDKNRREKQAGSTSGKALLILMALSIPAISAFAAEEAAVAPAVTSINGIPVADFYSVMGVIILELVAIFALVIYIKILLRAISARPELAEAAEKIVKKSWFWDKFNAAATIEQEKDILLDHDYDGIQELDNSLPPWWKYGFYLTIVVAVIYLYRFHISHDGPSSEEEFIAEVQQGEADKAKYLAKSANNVDENTVVILTDASAIASGKEMFIKTCAACHLADGGGTVGPNLTDEYWLHGGSVKDVFKSIKYGWQDKGMKSWKDDFSPKQIQEITSFVMTLKGTKPATPKAPQGELYIEASQGGKTDSVKTNTDSVKSEKVAVK